MARYAPSGSDSPLNKEEEVFTLAFPCVSDGEMKPYEALKLSSQLVRKRVHLMRLHHGLHLNTNPPVGQSV